MNRYLMIGVVIAIMLAGTASVSAESDREVALDEWRSAKFGLFVHWGIYSIPAGVWKGEEIPRLGEQIQRHASIPQDEYADLAGRFNPVKYDPDKWVRMAKRAGMKYIVITSKHHDGFNMFHTKLSDYNIVDATPYGKDIVKELADACARGGLEFGVYYSTPDWGYPDAVKRDPPNAYSVHETVTPEHEEYMVGQLHELLTGYGPLFEIFFDMGRPTLEQSTRFADTVHSLQAGCLASGRVMNDQGDFLTMPDNKLPSEPIEQGWETPGTLYLGANTNTWGYKSWVVPPDPVEQTREQVRKLASIASRGGNFLLNVGPKSDGTIPAYETDVLERIGKWMDVNGQSIHGTEPSPFRRLPWGECTRKKGKLYLHVFDWPADGQLRVPGLKNDGTAYMMGSRDRQPVRRDGSDMVITVPAETPDPILTVIEVRYKGTLDVVDPITVPDASGIVTLKGEDAFSHGKYSGMQYNSLTRNVAKSWDFEVAASGGYNIDVTYKTKFGDGYIFQVGDNRFDVDLAASKGGGWRTKRVGQVTLDRGRRTSLRVEFAPRSEMNETGKRRSLAVQVQKVTLAPE